MSPAGRPKTFDETEALEAAMGVFWEHGYEAASMAHLVEAMGIGRQSLYDTFGDKRGLYVHALTHYGESAVAKTIALLEQPGEPLDRLRAVLDRWSAAQSSPGCKGCFLANTLADLDRDDAEVASLVDALQHKLTSAFERVIEEAREKGSLAPGVDSSGLAALLTTIGHGLSIAGRSPSNTTLVPTAAKAALGLIFPAAGRA
jgi:AcrR family transcriptional regulator